MKILNCTAHTAADLAVGSLPLQSKIVVFVAAITTKARNLRSTFL